MYSLINIILKDNSESISNIERTISVVSQKVESSQVIMHYTDTYYISYAVMI